VLPRANWKAHQRARVVQRGGPPPMIVAQYRGKFCRGCWMQVTAPPWPSTPGNIHPMLPLRPTLLIRAHTRAEMSTITRLETLVVWFSVHCKVMQVRHRRRAPGEHEGRRRKGRRRKGRRCWCLEARGPKVQRPKAQGPKVLVFVCVCEGCPQSSTCTPSGIGCS